jgi:hypothetical protein
VRVRFPALPDFLRSSDTFYPQKLALTSPSSGGRSVCIVRSQTKATELVVGLERGPLSLVSTIEELLGRKSSGSGLESENSAVRIRHADHSAPPLSAKVGTNFFDNRRPVG